MDPLTDIFQFRAHLTSPWGIEVPAQPRVARFHIVVDGSCTVATGLGKEVTLQRGDLAIVPQGAAHTLKADEVSPVLPLSDVFDETSYDGGADLRYGGDGASTILVCGHFGFDDEVTHPVIDSFPPLLHMSAKKGHDFLWLDAATRSLGNETSRRSPGWEIIVSRVSEILFVQILRSQLSEDGVPSAIAAFSDSQLSHALKAIHEEPERDWDLETLARFAGMSRTAFAVRFREHLGLPPMAYITQWRLQRARVALVDTDEIVVSIAADHGYNSEAAFSRAFQRLYGKPPATYRKDFHVLQNRTHEQGT